MASALSITLLLNNIRTKIVWPIFAGLAIIMFIYAGIMFLTSSGDPGKLTKARDAVIWGAVGIVVALLSYGIIGFVNSLLK
jgi:hypothetical protein